MSADKFDAQDEQPEKKKKSGHGNGGSGGPSSGPGHGNQKRPDAATAGSQKSGSDPKAKKAAKKK